MPHSNDSDSTSATLANALSVDSGVSDRYADMNSLRVFPRYILEFIPQLFGYSLGERWQGLARSLIAAGPRQEVVQEVIRLAFAKLPGSDADDYLHLAALLAALEAGEELGEIAVDAFGRESEDIRQAGEFILEHYRNAIPPKFWR